MKQVTIFLVGLLATLSVQAQTTLSSPVRRNMNAVNITVNGNKNLQITVDGKDYLLNTNIANDTKTSIAISDLESGQHTFQVTRTGQNNRSEKISTIFTLRRRYDMVINVNANGSLELIEKLRSWNYGNNQNQAMNSAAFTQLLNNVKYQRTTTGKRSVITNAFNEPNNYFSSSQVVQLLQQVNGEAYRLELAKLSYRTVTDRNNFTQVSNLLYNQASRNELDAFTNNYYEQDNSTTSMSDANFNVLYESIRQQYPVSTQMTSLTNAFNTSNNYFTADQASRLIQIVPTESNRLQLAKSSYRSIVDRDNFYQVYELLKNQSSRNELENYVNNYQEGGYQGGGGNTGIPMSDANFNSLYQTIQQQWPVSAQMSSLTNAFNNTNNYFTTYQASRLIQLVVAENNRLQLAKLSYRSITDPANFSQVYSLLNTQASKNELSAYVNNNPGGGTGYKVAMSDANFNILYQNIQMQFLPGGKYTSLTNTFNNSSYYFTSAQARQLIELVSLESNRVQLAKLSYRNITDRNNFTQLYDLFYSQSSKDELQAYVNAYVD
ncbi:MAG TPA: DUF4476 domain-containing protein [Chitinophagaceae bacterium]|nr:DUF4476 domain-containing protein [Chitinophagaceae bacterium]